jgi:hypothetical protein
VNICLDCNSMYREPGTCNCWAPGGKRAPKEQAGSTGTITIKPEIVWEPVPHPADGSIQWTVHAQKCANCGGVYVGSHVCGYYNPHRMSIWCGGSPVVST